MDEKEIRECYQAALASYQKANDELGKALKAMHGIGEYPPPPKGLRFSLDDERPGMTRKMKIGFGEEGIKGYITSGTYSDGTLGEVFVTAEKQGSFVSGLMDSFAKVFSIALQSGVPLDRLTKKFMFTRFEPAGVTNNPAIPMATSPLDYLARWLELHYVQIDQEAEDGESVSNTVN